ncbi:hypothetical protein C9374_011952 [Naegleria lovaniensis]|uniref:Uncharacterized protein n=1 Tax=Naegleria lovaniensis TaxID=51637 RepID=A0AA88GF05_NAELO|nr:uncharacterized protein C9374_011952 [Naegleria lovaniensis]KAG2373663.1 hypothetical protein C9374_011952 [Naegleria lovaniensis]
MLYDLYSKEKQNGNEFKSLQFLEEYISTFIRSIPENQLTAEELEHLRRLTEKFIVKCNVVAMDYLTNQRNKNMSKACLDKAKNIIDLYGRIVFKEEEEKGTKLLVSTLSNFSVFYKECGNLEKALNALNLAQKAETHFNASLELNFCAVLSQMNRHEEALNHGLEALRQLELFKKLNRIKHNIASCNETLIIAFYNVAVEYEHLKQTTSAMEYYSKENASKLSARPSTLTSDSRGTHVRKVKPPSLVLPQPTALKKPLAQEALHPVTEVLIIFKSLYLKRGELRVPTCHSTRVQ